MIKEITTELWDIFQTITVKNHKKVLLENIYTMLRREKLLPKDSSVIIACGCSMLTHNFVNADFTVYGKDMNTVLYNGCVYGSICEETNELIELTLEAKIDSKLLEPKAWRIS